MSVAGAAGRRPGGNQIIPRPDRWEPGAPPPWEGIATPDRLDVDTVLAAVRARPSDVSPAPGTTPAGRPSAVLVALVDGPVGAEVLLTRRSWELRDHRGEVSFPGGRLEPGETPVEGALRESHEEVLLDPALVEVHGQLTPMSTMVSRSHIVPIVGRLQQRPDLRPGTTEVDRVFFVPLVELLAPGVYREERWGVAAVEWPVAFFELGDETIWGATGRILVDLLSTAMGLVR